MAELSRDEFFNALHERMGTDTSEEGIAFVENMTDTYNALEKRANQEIDWEQKYHDLDESWRERYRHRFFTASADMNNSGGVKSNTSDPEENEYDPEDISVSDLFSSVNNS